MQNSDARIGFAGLIHGHVWGLIDRFEACPGASLAAVADATELLDKARPRFGKSYADWRDMLEGEQLDGVVVTSDNRESAEIAIAALERGVPCLVEKAMAADAADADRMLAAARASGKPLMINWQTAWQPAIYELKRRFDAGEIGPAFHFKHRIGHRGPREIGCDEHFVGWLYDEARNGGGAIADFCCYGAVLSRWLLGLPESVFCIRDNFTKAYDVPDDHALCLLRYPKATALIEGTWATAGFDPSANPVLHGRDGTLSLLGETVVLNRPGGQEEFAAPPLAPDGPAEYFLQCLRGERVPDGIRDPEIAADACRILDAAKRSARSGCAEKP